MLSERALRYLRPLKFDARAERRSCVIPMGGIYWDDEIPDFPVLMRLPKDDRDSIFRVFSIRFKLWASAELDDGEQSFWDAARKQVPDCPVFHRVHLSEDDRAAQDRVEQAALAGLEALIGDADQVTIKEDGSFSAVFDLTKDKPQSLWQRILASCRNT